MLRFWWQKNGLQNTFDTFESNGGSMSRFFWSGLTLILWFLFGSYLFCWAAIFHNEILKNILGNVLEYTGISLFNLSGHSATRKTECSFKWCMMTSAKLITCSWKP